MQLQATAFLLVASLLLASAATPVRAAGVPGDPIAFTGHGVLFGPDGRQHVVTVDFVRRTQALYLAHLAEGLDARQRARLDQQQRYLADLASSDPQDLLYARALLIESVASMPGARDAAHIAARNAMLQWQLLHRLPLVAGERRAAGVDADYTPPDALRAQLRQIGLAERAPAAPARRDAAVPTYEDECKAAGVPTPPAWGAQAAGVDVWVSQGELTTLFEASALGAELFKWESATPPGVCLALPRYDKTVLPFASRLFGIICMGTKAELATPGAANKTSNACFWDWQGKRAKIKLKGQQVPISEFAAAPAFKDDAGGVCSDCHAGENAFVVHPEAAAFQNIVEKFVPETWVFPKVKAGWPLNPGPKNLMQGVALPAGEASCTECHYRGRAKAARLPDVATLPGYCAAVLDRAVRRTMPAVHAGGGADPGYKTHIELLYAACRMASPFPPP